MSSLKDLQQQLRSYEAELETIKRSGDHLIGVRVERATAGGSASKAAKEECKYARLRAGRGKLLPNGKKSLYIPVTLIAQYEAACDRGKRVEQLERQIESLKEQLWKLEQSQYRNLKDGKRKRFRQPKHASSNETSALPVIEVTPPALLSTPAAILILCRQDPNAPVHAVAAEVWQGNHKLAEVKARHCMGMKGNAVTNYIKELLLPLQQQFGITRFEDVIKEIPVANCPIVPCPLKHD